MDKEKLERLRRKYSDAPELHIFDEELKGVADRLLVDGGRSLPFAGMPTFLDAPYQEDFDNLDIALVGVPFDLGVSNRPGARFGPRAVRSIERIGPYNHQTKALPFGHAKIADVGDVPGLRRYDLSQGIAQIEDWFHKIKDAGVRPLTVGGDHSITYPILKALGRDEPVGLIHVDAHRWFKVQSRRTLSLRGP
jgi:agmatinase